ncbi:MAG: hypothetical protein PF503_17180 [Desulfobacula sp.]|jgi:hypothetical protein|nr:hypothetical protein [Desulfobacula sp.]
MRKQTYNSDNIKEFLKKYKIATMSELKTILGTSVKMTVIRKLKELSYYTSYSHRGKYYTLDEIANFDIDGLWQFEPALFSKYGTLLETSKIFINNSEAGLSARELEKLLHVEVKESVLNLYRNKKVERLKISGKYIYFSVDPKIKKRQILFRKDREAKSILQPDGLQSDLLAHELRAAILLFYTMLDEKQRRIYTGLESLKIGYGGDKQIAALFSIDPHTVAKGRSDLLNKDFIQGRIRKKGGGRIPTEKKSPKS